MLKIFCEYRYVKHKQEHRRLENIWLEFSAMHFNCSHWDSNFELPLLYQHSISTSVEPSLNRIINMNRNSLSFLVELVKFLSTHFIHWAMSKLDHQHVNKFVVLPCWVSKVFKYSHWDANLNLTLYKHPFYPSSQVIKNHQHVNKFVVLPCWAS